MSIESKALMQSEATVLCSASFKKARWMMFSSAAKELQISDDKARRCCLDVPLELRLDGKRRKDENRSEQFDGSDAADGHSLWNIINIYLSKCTCAYT